jgi:hypothetical protein
MYDEYPSWECIDSKKENTDPEDLYIDRCRGVKKRHMKDSGNLNPKKPVKKGVKTCKGAVRSRK